MTSREPLRVGVLLSGNGTSLENLLERIDAGDLPGLAELFTHGRIRPGPDAPAEATVDAPAEAAADARSTFSTALTASSVMLANMLSTSKSPST